MRCHRNLSRLTPQDAWRRPGLSSPTTWDNPFQVGDRIRVKAWGYLDDRLHGRTAQVVRVSGPEVYLDFGDQTTEWYDGEIVTIHELFAPQFAGKWRPVKLTMWDVEKMEEHHAA